MNIAIIGSSGAIGSAFVEKLAVTYPSATIHSFSRTEKKTATDIHFHHIDYHDEKSIETAALTASSNDLLDMVIVATGILHDDDFFPEKSLNDLSAEKFHHLFAVNTIVPALIAKYFLPKLKKNSNAIFAALSARIGSISDNKLGGWYAYRASKAALNMLIKNLSIETHRTNKQSLIVGLHPGTVDSALSKPFQNHVPPEKLFTPDFSVNQLISVLQNLSPSDSGKCFAWDGNEIQP